MTTAIISAAVLVVLGLVAGEAAARRYRSRLANAGRSRMPAPAQKVSIRL